MFDRYLQSQVRPKAWKRALLIVSIVVHAIAISGLIIWSFVHVEEVTPPPLTVTFFASAPPPPPPPPPPPKKKSSTVKKPKTTQVVQPTDVPKIVQPEPEPEPEKDEGEDEGVEGGVEGGVAGGVVGGEVGGVIGGVLGGVGTGPPPDAPKPKNVPPHVLAAQKISGDLPSFPNEIKAQYQGQQLKISVLVCITQSGAVDAERTKVLSAPPGTKDIVLQYLRAWRYKPQQLPICSPVNFIVNITTN
jgi:periplasmic protein TonB